MFSPGFDFEDTMLAIQYVRHCLPESQLIRDYVTFHIFLPQNDMPSSRIPSNEREAQNWPYDCEEYGAFYEYAPREGMYKTMTNLTFPINVARNIARRSANTHFILASDIELYPSLGFIDQFLRMAINNISSVLSEQKPRVFPLPVFEVQSNASIPNTKEQLVHMLHTNMAITFHKNVCPKCHEVPEQDQWIRSNVTTSDKLEVFTVAKRKGKFVSWEPFYVSDNREPLFDERFTWEGKWDKRIQNYAMCLLDFEYHILYPAFLVHAPGIKTSHWNAKRQKYVEATRNLIESTIPDEYRMIYGIDDACRI